MRRVLALLASLAALVATELVALAEPGEISGIDKVYLRSGPSTEGDPLGVLSAGDRVTILGSAGAWTNVQTQDGKVGYVHHRYVVPLTGVDAETVAELPATTPPPVSALSPVAVLPTPEPTTAPASDALSTDLANLQIEVSRLKDQVREYKQRAAEPPPIAAAQPRGAQPPTPTAAGDQAIGVLAVAGLSLLVGWFLGSVFSRRRSRSHRPRLRV
jgi:uncharacterized protein YgiM (DUF1202 family)